MRSVAAIILVLSSPSLARAQQPQSPPPEEEEWVAPPLIEAPRSDPPSNKGDAPIASPPTPLAPPGTPVVPHPHSPFGQAPPLHPPGPEIGLMVSESLFGMLTAAGSGLLLYYLVLKNLTQVGSSNPLGGDAETVSNLLFLLGFASVPLAVAQTEVGIANGSHFFSSEGWPAALSGLGAQAAVLGLYYLTRGPLRDGGEPALLIGTCIAVPLVEMAVINLTKSPRWQLPGGGFRTASMIHVNQRGEVQWGTPVPVPVIVPGTRGLQIGAQLSLAGGRF
jgi:hypothetical protein